MSWCIRPSAAAAVRISLISGGAALSWLAFSAGAATADDGEQSLLGSVTSVVESDTTPVESVVQDVSVPVKPAVEAVAPTPSEPVGERPGVSDLVSSVPEFIGNLSVSETVAPITNVVDSALSQVPVVNDVLPSGTVTTITQPVLETVDSAVAPVLPPVQQVVSPVVEVLDPIVETVDPVVDVVDPVVKPIVSPVADVVEPIVDPAPPVVDRLDLVDVVEPVLPEAAPAVPTDPAASSSTGDTEAGGTGTIGEARGEVAAGVTVAASEPSSLDERSPRAQTAVAGPVRLTDGPSEQANMSSPSSQIAHHQGARYNVQEAPQLVLADAQPMADSLGSPASASGTGGASSGSSSSGGMGAADTTAFFDFELSSAVSPQSGYSAALPQGPTFDPGSTPD